MNGQSDGSCALDGTQSTAEETCQNNTLPPRGESTGLNTAQRRALRRRLLRSANLKTLWGIVDVDTRLILETLGGFVHPRNGDVISRMLARHSEILERARQDDHRDQLLAELRRHGQLPAGTDLSDFEWSRPADQQLTTEGNGRGDGT